MIARIIIPIVLVLLLTDFYIDRCLLRSRCRVWRVVLWCQAVLCLTFSVCVAMSGNFVPDSALAFDSYMLLLGGYMLPKTVFAGCSFLGWAHCKYHKTLTNWGNPVGLLFAVAFSVMYLYGYLKGGDSVEVRRVEFASRDLPKEFDGYRILQFSDAHVGTFARFNKDVLAASVDSINSMRPDLIVFTGDLQNMQPSEIEPFKTLLSSLRAKDGVVSVLGNHDYAYYLDLDDKARSRNLAEHKAVQKALGWRLLCNEHVFVRRGGDSIAVVGMEYEGNSKKVPSFGNLKAAMNGVPADGFVLMLQHDPTAWRTDILPNSKAQLTLSGHTHGAQLRLMGWSPASLTYKEWGGVYYAGERAINVSTGLGGFIPFRLGIPAEVVEITLRSE